MYTLLQATARTSFVSRPFTSTRMRYSLFRIHVRKRGPLRLFHTPITKIPKVRHPRWTIVRHRVEPVFFSRKTTQALRTEFKGRHDEILIPPTSRRRLTCLTGLPEGKGILPSTIPFRIEIAPEGGSMGSPLIVTTTFSSSGRVKKRGSS